MGYDGSLWYEIVFKDAVAVTIKIFEGCYVG